MISSFLTTASGLIAIIGKCLVYENAFMDYEIFKKEQDLETLNQHILNAAKYQP